MIIALPIEIKVRELTSKMFLTYKILKDSNSDIVIGKKNVIFNFFKNNKNVFLLFKGGAKKIFPFNKRSLINNKIALLDEEGPLFKMGKYGSIRYSNFIFYKMNYVFLWGLKDLKLSKKFKNTLGKKTLITGHPKYDILKFPYYKYFDNEVRSIKKRFKNYVLISSSLDGGDLEADATIYNTFFQDLLPKTKKKESKKFLARFEKADRKNYKDLINIIIKLAKENKGINFIFRPHPKQSVYKVKQKFPKNIKNIKVVFEHSVTPWIIGCKLMIHSGCSTAFEAAVLKKKIIYFASDNFNHPKEYEKFGMYFNKANECINSTNKIINNKLKYSSKDLNKDIIKNYKKETFTSNLIRIIKNHKNNQENIYIDNFYKGDELYFKKLMSTFKNFILNFKIGSLFLGKVNTSLLLKKSHKIQKFPGLTKTEITKSLHNFKKIDKYNQKVYIKEIAKDCYYVSKNKNLRKIIIKS